MLSQCSLQLEDGTYRLWRWDLPWVSTSLCDKRSRVSSLLRRNHLQMCRNRNDLLPMVNIMRNECWCSRPGQTMMTSWSFTKWNRSSWFVLWITFTVVTVNVSLLLSANRPQCSIDFSRYAFHSASLPISSASDDVWFLRPATYHESQMLLHDQSS